MFVLLQSMYNARPLLVIFSVYLQNFVFFLQNGSKEVFSNMTEQLLCERVKICD